MAKRRSEYELNHDNWDDEEEEPEEVGRFQIAPEDVLKTRVIKQARRRLISSPCAISESKPKSVFASFNAFAGANNTNKFSFGTNLKNSNDNSDLSPLLKPSIDVVDRSNVSLSFLSKPSDLNPKPEPIKSSSNDAAVKITGDSANNRERLNELSNELRKTTDDKKTPLSAAKSVVNGEETPNETFLRKLKSLNLLCAEWIIKHLNESLDYILTPIFDDYAKHLKQLREERQHTSSTSKKLKIDDSVEITATETVKSSTSDTEDVTPVFKVPDFKESLSKVNSSKGFFSSSISKYNESQHNFKSSSFDIFKVPTTSENTGNGFKYPNATVGGGFKLFKNDSKSSGDATSFVFGQTSSTEMKPVADSVGESKPSSFFSFKPDNVGNNPFVRTGDNTKIDTNIKTEEIEEDQPPVVNDETITEEGSIYDKKCKVFIKREGNFVDHGVGFLFLKLVGDEKCQVIVRANNKLKNIIINALLTSSVPVQLLKKNNVMIVCCPTPEEMKPTTVLLRVKTPEDAEELLNTMNKYKK